MLTWTLRDKEADPYGCSSMRTTATYRYRSDHMYPFSTEVGDVMWLEFVEEYDDDGDPEPFFCDGSGTKFWPVEYEWIGPNDAWGGHDVGHQSAQIVRDDGGESMWPMTKREAGTQPRH
jgi:hypothetical protein